MSRRSLVIWVLAASATLTVGPATADRECFANLCNTTAATVQPPAKAVPQSAKAAPQTVQPVPAASALAKSKAPEADQSPPPFVPKMVKVMPSPLTPAAPTPMAPKPAVPAPTVANTAPAAAPIRAHPQMVVDPAPRLPVPALGDDAQARQSPLRPAPRYSEDARPPVRAAKQPPLPPRPASYPAHGPLKEVDEATASLPARIYAKRGVVVSQPDPHYSSYRIHRGVPVYVLAPNAKIISIDPED
jgi:hypothetical protein